MAILGTRYNNGMSNVNQNPCNCEPMCTTCGRPWVVCKGECGCKKSCCNNVNFCEYGKKVSGCLRSVEPSCPMQAVIPSVVVEDVTGLKNLADCFVHVTNINTTFYIDDKHRTMVTWAGPVEYDNYDLDANTLGLRSQFLIDHANDYAAYYNKTGEYQKFNFSEGGGTADAVDWGHITGSMSNQTDLTTALNAKANTADLEEAVRQLQTGMENAISMVQQNYGIPHYSLYDLPDGTGWNSTTSDNFSVIGVDSPLDLFQSEFPPFVLNCSQLGSYRDDDGGETTVYNILMESGQLFVDGALVEMFIGETFIPSKDDISRGTQFMVIIQRDEDEEVVLRTRAHTIYLD